MEHPPLPPATLELHVDSAALADNWRTLDRLSGAARAGAAVKADGYGLGVHRVMQALTGAGARDFFVAHWSEVPAVLDHVPGASIGVLHGPVTPAEAVFAHETGVRPVINSLHQARVWLESGGGPCHLMIDTGINRLGLPMADLADPLIAQLNIAVAMSHLASADEDSAFNGIQVQRFREAKGQVKAREYSLANSAGIGLGRAYHFDLTRPGLAIYGGTPTADLVGCVRQVVSVRAAIIQMRHLEPGEHVGYNARFTADQPMRVATISLGYADGLLRVWADQGALHHDGLVLPFLGRVSMDMVVVDVSAASHLREGDFLDLPYDLRAASETSGLSQYELLTTLGKRFARITG